MNPASKSLMVFAVALPIIMLNTSYGVRGVSPIRAQMALYALILLTGGLGYLMNLAFALTEKRLSHWNAKW